MSFPPPLARSQKVTGPAFQKGRLVAATPVACSQSIVVREELEIRVTSWDGPDLGSLDALEAEACIPLINKGHLIGFCNLGSCISLKMYSGEDMHMLATLGHNAAIALDNALLYEELKRHKTDTAHRPSSFLRNHCRWVCP